MWVDLKSVSENTSNQIGVVHILRNQPRGGGGFQMLTVDYGGGGGGFGR